jgi:lysophospholipase L1-like esterase
MDLINLQSIDADKFTIVSPNKVSVWAENNGTQWSQATDANRPLLNDGIIFDGSNDALARSAEVSANDYSLYCVFRILETNNGAIANKSLFAALSSTNWLGIQPSYNMSVNVSGASRRLVTTGYKGNRFVVLGIRKSGNNFTFSINDRVCLQSGTNAVTNTLFGRLASISGFGAFSLNVNIKSFCLSSQVLSDVVHKKVVDTLYNQYNLSSNISADNVCGFGDSNTTGQGATSYLVALSTSMNLAHLNLGISGTMFQNTTGQANNGYSRYQSQLVSKPFTDYVVVQYGTNDILTGQSASIFETQLNAMIGDLISQGYNPSRICLCSNPYQVSNQNSALLDDYRTRILNVATAHGTKYFDLLQDTRDNGGNSLLVDAVHLNATGQTRWTNGVYTAFTT